MVSFEPFVGGVVAVYFALEGSEGVRGEGGDRDVGKFVG